MEDTFQAEDPGFIIAVVIFWLLAAGLLGTAFVLYQENAQSELSAEQMDGEQKRIKNESGKLLADVDKLRNDLDSSAQGDDQVAIATVKAKCGEAPHVRAALTTADLHLAGLEGQKAVFTTQTALLKRQLATAHAEKTAADDEHTAKVKDLERRTKERGDQVQLRVDQLNRQQNALTSRIKELEAVIESDTDQMRKDVIYFERALARLLHRRRELKDELRLTVQFRPDIAGRVQVADMVHDFAYIDVGRQDGARPGLRFSVYPADAVFREHLKPKAVVEINRVDDEKRSQTRVIRQTLSDPVVAGDLLVNVAFDGSGRKPTFVLVYFLDIDNDNVDDRDDIIQMILDQGGMVLPPEPDAVNVNTDFILVGEQWDLTVPGSREGDLFKRDNPIVGKAMRRSVTQLDVETFLNYIGYPKWR